MKTKHEDNAAIFAAGCFWGVQAVFDQIDGITKTVVGYTGGHTENPTYHPVCTGTTGHAEAIYILFNTETLSYQQLIDTFFANHNPTTRNQQGPDKGSQYRSAIFYINPEQQNTAEQSIIRLTRNKVFDKPIVTTLEIAGTFYPAEDYHQQYYKKHNVQCQISKPK